MNKQNVKSQWHRPRLKLPQSTIVLQQSIKEGWSDTSYTKLEMNETWSILLTTNKCQTHITVLKLKPRASVTTAKHAFYFSCFSFISSNYKQEHKPLATQFLPIALFYLFFSVNNAGSVLNPQLHFIESLLPTQKLLVVTFFFKSLLSLSQV